MQVSGEINWQRNQRVNDSRIHTAEKLDTGKNPSFSEGRKTNGSDYSTHEN